MAQLVHVERSRVKAACTKLEKQMAKDPEAQRERQARERDLKAEKTRRDREYGKTQPRTKARSAPKLRKGRAAP